MKTYSNALDDIVPYDNSKETSDFNFQREDKDRIIPELGLHLTEQQSDTTRPHPFLPEVGRCRRHITTPQSPPLCWAKQKYTMQNASKSD